MKINKGVFKLLLMLFQNLMSCAGLIMLVAFIMTKVEPFRKLVAKQNINIKDKLLLALIFGIYGII